jgi:hypothetical protein
MTKGYGNDMNSMVGVATVGSLDPDISSQPKKS